MATTANDIEFCREKAFAANPLLRASLPFVSDSLSDRLYALHALFASVELSLSSVSDDEVAQRKLAWWLEEVSADARSASQHPVMRELHRNGAATLLPWDRFSTWLSHSMNRVDPASPSTIEELHALCREVGEGLVDMELATVGAMPESTQAFSDLAARRGLAQVIREAGRFADDRKAWWYPLDIMARHGLRRTDLSLPGKEAVKRKLSKTLSDRFFTEIDTCRDILHSISIRKQNITNIIILDAQISRKLKNMKTNSPFKYGEVLKEVGFGDVLAGWKAARRINRLK